MTPKFLINEIHSCLQGEGVHIGKPAVLVRFHICNLRCSWCDTPYTHTFKSDVFKRTPINELVQEILKFNIPHIILTGGEPTLQNLGVLSRALKEHNPNIFLEVESNGTQIPHQKINQFLESDYSLMQWNISPKFENAKESIVPEALQFWSNLSKNHLSVFFKFVIRKRYKDKDLKRILEIISEFNIDSTRIILMAEGTTQKSQLSNQWLHDICLQHGFRFSSRLHILIFGAKRGV